MDEHRRTLIRHTKTYTIRVIDMTLLNIARIFQVKPETIYLVNRDNGVVVLPMQEEFFNHYELTGETYLVEGENACSSASSATGTTVPAITSTFRFPPSSSQPRAPPTKKYSRSVFIAQLKDNETDLHSQVTTVTFTEEQANVDGIANAVKSCLKLDVEIILTDGSGRRIMASPGNSGVDYWRKGARKIVAFRIDLYEQFVKMKKKRPSQGDVLSSVRGAIDDFVHAAEALPTVAAELRDVGNMREQAVRQQVETLRATFQCVICRSIMEGPVLALCCRSLIGCRDCLNLLLERSEACPKCRAPVSQERIISVAGLSEVLGTVRGLDFE